MGSLRTPTPGTTIESVVHTRRKQATRGELPRSYHTDSSRPINASVTRGSQSRLRSALSRPLSALDSHQDVQRRPSASGPTRGTAPRVARAQSAIGFRSSSYVDSDGRGASAHEKSDARHRTGGILGSGGRVNTPWSASYRKGSAVGKEVDTGRARGRALYGHSLVERAALSDIEGLGMEHRVALELGARASSLDSRLQGLEALASHFGERVAAPSSIGLADQIDRAMQGIQEKMTMLSNDFLDSGDIITTEAATLIQKMVRGLCARRRYQRACAALSRWRWKSEEAYAPAEAEASKDASPQQVD